MANGTTQISGLPFQQSISPQGSTLTTPAVSPGGDAFRVPTTTPIFEELRKRLSQPTQIASLPTLGTPGATTEATFQQGIQALAPTGGIRPETQRVLDLLAQRTKEAQETGVSEAQALAVRRGLSGSSIEQFGTAEAIRAAQEAGRGAEAEVLLQNLQNDVQFQQLQGQAFLDRARQIDQITSNQEIARLQAEAARGNKQAEFDLQAKLAEAGLTSDEINTQRNIDLQLQQLEVERILGERGLALTEENIRQAQDQARRASRDQLVGNLVGAFGPQLLFGRSGILGGGGGGVFNPAQATGGLSALLSGGALGGATATGQTARTLFAPASAAGAPAAAGAGGLFAGGALGGALAIGGGILGGIAGRRVFGGNQRGDAAGSFAGSLLGGGIGFGLGGPLGAAGGAFLGAGVGKFGARTVRGIGKIFKGETPRSIKNVGNEISKGVKKIFPF